MDLDKPLEDIISDNRKSAPRGGRGRGGPRPSRERSAPTPYARPPPRSTEDAWVHDAFQGGGNRRGPPPLRDDAARVAGTGVGFTGVSPRIEVIGLHYEVTPADLKSIFSQAGTLVQGPNIRTNAYALLSFVCFCHSQYDRSGRSKGEAIMEFASYQQAKIAINKFDGAMTKGQTISIRLLPPITARTPAGPGGRAQTQGSLLSRISGGGAPAPQASRGAPRGGRGGVDRGRGRGSGRGRGGGGGGGGSRPAPANADDLDKQLDGFMAGSADGPAAGDVDMS